MSAQDHLCYTLPRVNSRFKIVSINLLFFVNNQIIFLENIDLNFYSGLLTKVGSDLHVIYQSM